MLLMIAGLFAIIFTSCTEPEDLELTKLQHKQEKLVQKIMERNTQINDLNNYLSGLEAELDELLSDYQLSGNDAESGDGIDRILVLRKMISEYQSDLDKLSNEVRIKSSNLATMEYELESMGTELGQREVEIQELVSELFDLTTELTFTQEAADLAILEVELYKEKSNKVYVATGTFKELEAAGIATKKGGIFGLGGQKMIDPSFDTSLFEQTDKRSLKTIPISNSKIEVLSIHPPESYTVKMDESKSELVIEDAEAFWSASKYLAIATKN